MGQDVSFPPALAAQPAPSPLPQKPVPSEVIVLEETPLPRARAAPHGGAPHAEKLFARGLQRTSEADQARALAAKWKQVLSKCDPALRPMLQFRKAHDPDWISDQEVRSFRLPGNASVVLAAMFAELNHEALMRAHLALGSILSALHAGVHSAEMVCAAYRQLIDEFPRQVPRFAKAAEWVARAHNKVGAADSILHEALRVHDQMFAIHHARDEKNTTAKREYIDACAEANASDAPDKAERLAALTAEYEVDRKAHQHEAEASIHAEVAAFDAFGEALTARAP